MAALANPLTRTAPRKTWVGEESAEHTQALSQPASVSSGRWQRFPQHTSTGREDEDADGGEETNVPRQSVSFASWPPITAPSSC